MLAWTRVAFFCIALIITVACERGEDSKIPSDSEQPTTSQSLPLQSPAEEAFPALIEKQLASEGLPVTVVNAGVSGDTTAGGLRRLSWILRQKPHLLVICLGGNDGLRNLDVAASKENLRQIITDTKAAGTEVLLLGMMIPTNYGPMYREQFAAIFPALAEETGVPIVPFALEGVAGNPQLNQPDGIHPTAEGQKTVASNVIGPLRELVQKQMKK